MIRAVAAAIITFVAMPGILDLRARWRAYKNLARSAALGGL